MSLITMIAGAISVSPICSFFCEDSSSETDVPETVLNDVPDEVGLATLSSTDRQLVGEKGDNIDNTTSKKKVTDISWKLVKNLSADKQPAVEKFKDNGVCSGPVWKPLTAEPVEYFNRFFEPVEENGSSLWDFLVEETNRYAAQYKDNNARRLSAHSKVHKWQHVDADMIKSFIGLIINMGLIKKHGLNSYWNTTDFSQDTPMFRKIFTLDTFKLIHRFFHTSNSQFEPARTSAGYDPTYKFVLDHFNSKWDSEYSLHREICIDESIVGFKGRHILVNYIRIKKHHQWGPKEYNLCDSRTGYMARTIFHKAEMKISEYGQPFDVCNKLIEGKTKTFHHLYADNYYMSINLCQKILEKEVYVTGTVQGNRKHLPVNIKSPLKIKGSAIAVRDDNMVGLIWMDRKQVRMLSTCSNVRSTTSTKYDGTTREIPNIVREYNKYMGGVDVSDQMTDHYSAELKTFKCWRKVVFHLISRSCTNAYICYNAIQMTLMPSSVFSSARRGTCVRLSGTKTKSW